MEEAKELGKDIIKLILAFTPLSNLLSITLFLKKWVWNKYKDDIVTAFPTEG